MLETRATGELTRKALATVLGTALALGVAGVFPRSAWAEEPEPELQLEAPAAEPYAFDPTDTTGQDDIILPDELPAGAPEVGEDTIAYGEGYTRNLRVYGGDRYGTALENAYFRYEQEGAHPCVVIAQGGSFPDALSGGYVCVKNNAPMLLVDAKHEQNVLDYLAECAMSDATIYLLGGKNVVSTGFEGKLRNQGYHVVRLAGGDRYGTNLDILRKTAQDSTELLVARGSTFPDALSGSSVGKPMLLVNGSLSSAQLAWLQQSNVSSFYILGGTSAVSREVENQLRTMGSVERIGGANRYDTSAKIARRFFPNSSCITVATGTKFPDALSGAPVAAYFDAPLVLVSSGNWSYAHGYVADKGIGQLACIGGPKAVTHGTLAKVMYGTYNWPTLASKGVKANGTWRFSPTVTDAQINELLYDIEGYSLIYASPEFQKRIKQYSGMNKTIAVLTYIGSTYGYGSSPRGYDMIAKGSGTCFAYSELVYSCLKKLGLTCWLTVPGRNRSSQNPMGGIYGSMHRTVVVKIDGKLYDADGNMALYTVQFNGVAEPFEISTAYADYLIGKTNSFNG